MIDSIKIQFGLHSGDIYYIENLYEHHEICFKKKRVLSEPQLEIDEQGKAVWMFEEEDMEILFFYRDLYGRFQQYKSKKMDEGGKQTCQITIENSYSCHGYANNPMGTSIDDIVCIVFLSNDSNEDFMPEELQNSYIRSRGMWDYVEVADEKDKPGYIDPHKHIWRRRAKLGLIILASFAYLYFFTNWFNVFLVCIFDLISLGIYLLWNSSWGESEYKTTRGNMIKSVLEYDFGEDYKMLVKGWQQQEGYLFLLPEEAFEKLKKHLNSIPDGDYHGKGIVAHEKDDNHTIIGFTLYVNRLHDGCGNTESIHVDYIDKTLKYSFVIY